jgi:hypothetical protein
MILLASSDRASSPFGLGSGDPVRSPFVTRVSGRDRPRRVSRARSREGAAATPIGRRPHLDFAASKAVRCAVEMALELDMVIDADPAQAALGKAIGAALW